MATRPEAAIQLDAVTAIVDAARRSLRRSEGLAVLAKAAMTGLGGAALSQAAMLAGLGEVAREDFFRVAALTGAGFFVVGLVGFGAMAAMRMPSANVLAQGIDRRLGLKERLSTALEAAGWRGTRPGDEEMMRRALFADAESTAGRVAHKDVDARRSWRFAWGLPVLAALVLALGAVEASQPPPQIVATAPVALTQEERQETAEVLRQIADLLGAQKTQTPTPVLEALTRTIETVRSDLVSAPLDRNELAQTLEDLKAQAAQAAGAMGDSTSTQIEKALGEQISAIERGPQLPPEAAADLPASAVSGNNQAQPPANNGGKKPLPTTEAAQTSLQPNQPKPKGSTYYTPDPHAVSRQIAERTQSQQLSSGVPAGGADKAERGGNQAGEGIRPLKGNMDELAAQSAAALDTMVLPQNDASAGQRVRISTTPPEAVAGAAVDGTAQAAGWQTGEVEPFNRNGDPLADAEILRRYFPQTGGEF